MGCRIDVDWVLRTQRSNPAAAVATAFLNEQGDMTGRATSDNYRVDDDGGGGGGGDRTVSGRRGTIVKGDSSLHTAKRVDGVFDELQKRT